MPHIHTLKIKNFRGIKEFEQQFKSNFICLIGRGDSGKSSILEAISCVLSPSWNLQFFDNDFHNCDTSAPIFIEVTLTGLPDDLITEDKFGLHLRAINTQGEIIDEIENGKETALTIRLEVHKDLEPQWNIVTERDTNTKKISANDRSKLNAFLVADYAERHFSWAKGSPLYSLLRQESGIEENDDAMIDALREAKSKIDDSPFAKFDPVINKIKTNAATFGIDISKVNTTIDFRDIVMKDGKVGLHDAAIPFRLKGKGSKRLISMAIQAVIADVGGIVLIDEIEQGLEPDRVQSLVHTLKTNNHGHIFITSHSRDVAVELTFDSIFLMRKGSKSLLALPKTLQGTLRQNPEAFFARKVLMGEGASEIGMLRALNEYRKQKGLHSIAYHGVRFADGGGNTMIEHCAEFMKMQFPTALFCDSDEVIVNAKKQSLRDIGVAIFDWDGSDTLEMAVFKFIPFKLLPEVFDLAATIKHEEDDTNTLDQYKDNMWASVTAHFGAGCPVNMQSATDSSDLRSALANASASKNKEWFKRQNKSFRLGKIIFDHFDELDAANPLKKQLMALSDWIDS